jgi:hypothetical protein
VLIKLGRKDKVTERRFNGARRLPLRPHRGCPAQLVILARLTARVQSAAPTVTKCLETDHIRASTLVLRVPTAANNPSVVILHKTGGRRLIHAISKRDEVAKFESTDFTTASEAVPGGRYIDGRSKLYVPITPYDNQIPMRFLCPIHIPRNHRLQTIRPFQ